MTRARRRAYLALLRAVNVGGRGIVKMADLRAQLAALELDGVATYIQSGNAVFTAREQDPDELARAIEARVAAELGHRGAVFVRTVDELRAAAANNPFEPAARAADQRCHLMFLSAVPARERRAALLAPAGDDHRFAIAGRVAYHAYPRAVTGRRRTIDLERVLGVAGTARAWNVVDQLIALARALPLGDRRSAPPVGS